MQRHTRSILRQADRRVPIGRLFTVVSLVPLVALLALGSAGCGAAGASQGHVTGKAERPYTAADAAQTKMVSFPSYVKSDVRDGYEYAVAHPEQLRYIPCYCGCGLTASHKSNLDCYVAGADKNGAPVFDEHASFCGICLEITRDVKRMSAEGKSLGEIRAYVDRTHGEKGPGTDTAPPPS